MVQTPPSSFNLLSWFLLSPCGGGRKKGGGCLGANSRPEGRGSPAVVQHLPMAVRLTPSTNKRTPSRLGVVDRACNPSSRSWRLRVSLETQS